MSTQLVPDLEQARAFLRALDPAGVFTFQTLDDQAGGRERDATLVRIFHGTLDMYAATLTTLNTAGAGVFVMINKGDLRGRKAENVIAVRAFYVDLDGARLEPVLEAVPAPSIVVDSSPGRWHAYWLIDGHPLDDFSRVQREFIRNFDGDETVCDLPRVMRLPGFYHRKTDIPYLVRIHEGIGDAS